MGLNGNAREPLAGARRAPPASPLALPIQQIQSSSPDGREASPDAGQTAVKVEATYTSSGKPVKLRRSGQGKLASACVPPTLLSRADERVPEEKTRLILVVRAAAQLDVVRRGCTSRRIRRDVMELEERGFAALTGAPPAG
jgi:hypothetical protein